MMLHDYAAINPDGNVSQERVARLMNISSSGSEGYCINTPRDQLFRKATGESSKHHLQPEEQQRLKYDGNQSIIRAAETQCETLTCNCSFRVNIQNYRRKPTLSVSWRDLSLIVFEHHGPACKTLHEPIFGCSN